MLVFGTVLLKGVCRDLGSVVASLRDLVLIDVAHQLLVVRFKLLNEGPQVIGLPLVNLEVLSIGAHLAPQVVVLGHDSVGVGLCCVKATPQVLKRLVEVLKRGFRVAAELLLGFKLLSQRGNCQLLVSLLTRKLFDLVNHPGSVLLEGIILRHDFLEVALKLANLLHMRFFLLVDHFDLLLFRDESSLKLAYFFLQRRDLLRVLVDEALVALRPLHIDLPIGSVPLVDH